MATSGYASTGIGQAKKSTLIGVIIASPSLTAAVPLLFRLVLQAP
jgi:hypothetical protein